MKQVASWFKRNAPILLAGLSSIGTIAVGVAAAEGTPKALKRLEDAKNEKGTELSKAEIVIHAVPAYLPAVALAAGTILCTVGSVQVGKQTQAALVGAYAMLDRIHREYQEKAKELYGEEADREIRRKIVCEHVPDDKLPPWDGNMIFYEEHYGKFFERSREQVLLAEYDFNRNFVLRGYASLNEFFSFLGLPQTDAGEKLGWSLEAGDAFYGYSWVDFEHRMIEIDDGLQCCEIIMPFPPTADYLSDFFG